MNRAALRRRRRGISLLEVLTAMVIFLMALVGISQLLNMCNSLALDVQFTNRAAQLLQSKMNEAVAGSVSLTGASEGSFDEEPDWMWSVEGTEDSSNPGLYNVTVYVWRSVGSKDDPNMSWSLKQMVLDPALRGTIEAPTSPATGSTTPMSTTPMTTPMTPMGGP